VRERARRSGDMISGRRRAGGWGARRSLRRSNSRREAAPVSINQSRSGAKPRLSSNERFWPVACVARLTRADSVQLASGANWRMSTPG
jgi:hypothetical protein